jgi:hypothetical protein
MEVREIAAASAGDENLLARAIGTFQDRDAPAAFARLDRAHQPRGSGAQNYRIKFVDHDREASSAKPTANDYYIIKAGSKSPTRQSALATARRAHTRPSRYFAPAGFALRSLSAGAFSNSKHLLYRG